MNNPDSSSTMRAAGRAAITGSILMLIGAALWGSTGTDLWAALAVGDVAGYLAAAGEVKGRLVANLSFWILGVLVLGLAGILMADLSARRTLARAALVCVATAVPLAIVSFIAMAALVVQIAPDASETSVALANTVGWIGARSDDLATVLIVGAAPLLLSLAGRGDWAPGWLVTWGWLAALAGIVSLLAVYVPAMSGLGFVIVPVGIGWMIAAGVALTRRAAAAP